MYLLGLGLEWRLLQVGYLSNKNIKQWVQYQVNVCVIVLHRWTVVIWVYKKLKLTYWTSHPCFIFQSWRPNVWNRFLICVTFFITNKGKKSYWRKAQTKCTCTWNFTTYKNHLQHLLSQSDIVEKRNNDFKFYYFDGWLLLLVARQQRNALSMTYDTSASHPSRCRIYSHQKAKNAFVTQINSYSPKYVNLKVYFHEIR